MKLLSGTARNILFLRNDDGETSEAVEAVFVLATAAYEVDSRNGLASLAASHTVEPVRFVSSPDGLRELAKTFIAWADEAEAAMAEFSARKPEEPKS